MVRNPKPSLVKIADDEVQDMCNKVKERVEEKTTKTYSEFKATSYRTLVDYVHGRIIVFIKVLVGEDSYMHLRVFRIIPSRHGEVELEEILDEKKDSDPLEAFEAVSQTGAEGEVIAGQ
ncbi:cystatin-A-like [Dendronephthya gigantea]|uniref:cystatin-A-like n=1 Tax=Dendronephthya gigantea TaxID=151771 RepID=UPI001069FA23|nr:cystatin-A-like [Dendronephthya gigantea]